MRDRDILGVTTGWEKAQFSSVQFSRRLLAYNEYITQCPTIYKTDPTTKNQRTETPNSVAQG